MHVYLNTANNSYTLPCFYFLSKDIHDLNTVERCTFNKYSTIEACLENKNNRNWNTLEI